MNSPKSEVPRLPHLFGAYERTALIVALRRSGPIVGRDVRHVFSENIYRRGYRAYKSNLVERIWLGPGRGYAFALNNRFPAHAALARLLDVLAEQIGFRAPSQRSDAKSLNGRVERATEVKSLFLFDSAVRTSTLLALEAIGGAARSGIVAKAVLAQHPSSVKSAVRFFVDEGVLVKRGASVGFDPAAPWTEPLRALLRESLSEHAAIGAYAIERSSSLDRSRPHLTALNPATASPLFTYANSKKFLIKLAISGPQRLRDVIATSGSASEKRLRRLIRIGVLCRTRVGREVYYSLNAAHPIYKELRALLRAISTSPPKARSRLDGRDERSHFDVERLFGPKLSTNVLVFVAIAPRGEIDGASIFRLLPEHDRGQIQACLNRYERIGVLASRSWKTARLFRLDPGQPAYRQLRSLLRAIASRWSEEYLDAAALEAQLRPLVRRRMESTR